MGRHKQQTGCSDQSRFDFHYSSLGLLSSCFVDRAIYFAVQLHSVTEPGAVRGDWLIYTLLVHQPSSMTALFL